jgi:hypothetical protein
MRRASIAPAVRIWSTIGEAGRSAAALLIVCRRALQPHPQGRADLAEVSLS